MSAHGYDQKRFPLTAAQGRVLYHLERIYRSTGAGMAAHAVYLRACVDAGLNARRVQDWTQAECVQGLQMMERNARQHGLARFRPVATGWQDFAPGGRFARSEITGCWLDEVNEIFRRYPTLALA